MYMYLVTSEHISDEVVKSNSADMFKISTGIWVVCSSEYKTCAELCEALGLLPGAAAGVVVKFREYYGTFDPSLWQKIEAWERGA